MARVNGSVQGPTGVNWGYTEVSVADWDLDSKPDIVVSDIWGKVVWYWNIGTATQPRLATKQISMSSGKALPQSWTGTGGYRRRRSS
jgi:hypothetical protein